ncbi:bifunctional DNA primase/polymerase [Streptomyces sp. DH37]|uniref:bifunctional DNA primase/polymerase n=1 Tax=Streptomyces sp. DH37 TaxID=3040122 RepID=UPI002442FBAF|nr:bifunctional DNA primase/polymerase [Streptomyces sp. DH37]MDG9706259.1 bifunctional DNA primase/polymerase [Streptomyces sp. DH37]
MSAWTDALDSALYAITRGHAVFPLSANKTPAIRSPHQSGHGCKGDCGQPGHGVHDATTDPARARHLFDLAPRATGYGIACGGRMIGLDLDRKNGVDGVATLHRLAAEHGFEVPRTLTVCTPSGGFHLWFAAPGGTAVPNSAGRLGPGIDVRGTGGYLVGPGSRGRNGLYGLHPSLGEVDVQPAPGLLLRLMLPAPVSRPRPVLLPRSGGGGRVLEGLVRVVAEAAEGTRNDRLFWAAAKAWAHVRDGHIAAGDVEAALVAAAVGTGLGEGEARRTVASAQRGTGVAA